nr:putative sporulation protein YtxC [Halobacillus kuroshimensis]
MVFDLSFSKRLEAETFYNAIVSEQKLWVYEESGKRFSVKLMHASSRESAYVDVVRALHYVVRKRKIPAWMEGVLRFSYHFEDADEIQRILEIEQDFDSHPPAGLRLPPIHHYIKSFIQEYVHVRDTVLFDDLSAGCLAHVHRCLTDYTGKVIDEYKQEESYQLLVDSWRHRVHHQDTGVQLLHILDDRGLTYFHDEGNPLSDSETRLYQKQYPDEAVSDLPLEWPVTPALVHAPEEIIIYSDQAENSNLELLMNIFEEKAVWKPKSQFPF